MSLCTSLCLCCTVCTCSIYLYTCLALCTYACVRLTLQCPLCTPLHVFFGSVNSWLLEQNNCHFPASGSKVIQHNEMYKKEGKWQTGGMLNQM